MALIETHFYSKVLQMEMKIHVILPQEKKPYKEQEKLKVLWLLHGGSGDDTAWLRMTSIERYANQYGIAVVVPGVFNSCYTDMAHGGKFFTYMTEELPRIVHHFFPNLSEQREDHFISGLSNGGYGCLKLGLARPDLYGAIGAFSAGDKSDVAFVNDGSTKALGRIILFGDGDMKGTENDLQYLAKRALQKEKKLPRIYHACGDQDPWLDLNHILRDFFTGLEENPYHYQYHEAKGYGHEWAFWEDEILRFFEFVGLQKTTEKFIGV